MVAGEGTGYNIKITDPVVLSASNPKGTIVVEGKEKVATTTTTVEKTPKTPKTGETNIVTIAGVTSLLSAAVALTILRKRNQNI